MNSITAEKLESNLYSAYLVKTNLSEGRIEESNLYSAYLVKTNLSEGRIEESNLTPA